MIGWTLFRYFIGRYLVVALQALGLILLIAYMIDFTDFARRSDIWPDYTLAKGLYLSAMRMPLIAMSIWPFVALIAGMITLIGLNRQYELVVVRAAGISAWQFLVPICAGALTIGSLAVTVVNPIAARAQATIQDIELAFRGYSPKFQDELRIPWLVDNVDGETTIIGAARTARRGSLLGDAVFIRVNAEGDIYDRLDARSATLEPGRWRLEGVRRTDPERRTTRLEVEYVPTELDPALIEERVGDNTIVPIYQLPARIRAARAVGLPATRLATQFHNLLALPALMMAMTIIAATTTLRFNRTGQSASLVLGGVLAGFLLYVALVTFTAFGNVGFIAPPMAAWTPVIIAFFLGATSLLHREDG